jgi:hypothetical protein
MREMVPCASAIRVGLTSIAIVTAVIATAAVATAAIWSGPSPAAVKSVERVVLKSHMRDVAGLDEPASLQAPVATTAVFKASLGATTACVSAQKVLDRLQADRKAMGGKTVMLADGLQQSFADAWRREAQVPSVTVSSVVAHLFSDASGSEWNADIIEFDANGCAMSRTLVPGEIWTGLLESAFGSKVYTASLYDRTR